MARVFTRKEFQELVWSKPTVQLAKEFGLSDVALGKICRKHDIPKPPLGWWAKREAGRTVAVTPLPKARSGISDAIVIAGGETKQEPDILAAAREAARILVSGGIGEGDPEAHPIVARTAAKLRKGKPADTGLVSTDEAGLIKASIAPASIDRFELAMSRMAAALALVGATLQRAETSAVIACDGEMIGISVTETLRREKHVLTAKEIAEDEARKRRWAKLRNPLDELLEPDHAYLSRPKFDYHPGGQMSLTLDARYLPDSVRRTFADAKIQRLEMLAPDIAVGVAVMAAAFKLGRLRQEEEARRREEERQRREQALRLRHVEERRRAALDSVLEELAGLDRLRRLVENLRSQLPATESGRIATFVRVAEDRLADVEAALSPDGLSRRFSEQRLFGDDDDHGFRPPPFYG